MEYSNPQILVYITSDENRVIGGDPLTLFIPDENERQNYITDMAHALKADVVQLKSGDYMIISS
jgi:hypothetical protein